MKAISQTLIHFLGRSTKNDPDKQFEIFKNIIEEGLKLSNITNIFGFGGGVHNESVCFTDIPLNFCDEHTSVYGRFGIGFTKSFVKNCGGNPVSYFVDYPITMRGDDTYESRGILFYLYAELLRSSNLLKKYLDSDTNAIIYKNNGEMLLSRDDLETFLNYHIQLLSFTKPMGDLGPARDGDDDDTFYNEREWRILPVKANIQNGAIIQKESGFFIPFSRSDIRVIIVPNNEVKRKILDYLASFKLSKNPRLFSFSLDMPTIIVYDELKYF